MIEKINKYSKSIYIPFIIFAIILICFHIPIGKSGDDLWFQNILNDDSMKDFLIERYNNWTSRTIIESVLVLLTNTNVSTIIWKVINIFMFELLAYSIFKIFIKDIKDENKKLHLTWILVFGILSIPFTMLQGAGWIATTTNYLWPLALRSIFMYINNKKFKWRKT